MSRTFQEESIKRHVRDYLVTVAISLFVLLGVVGLSEMLRYSAQESERLELLNRSIGNFRSRLELQVNTHLQASKSIADYINLNPEISQSEFARYSQLIFQDMRSFRNVAAAKDLVISHIFPVEGNESTLGVNYNTLPEQLPSVELALTSGKIVLSGPVELIQGGKALIARVPVYSNEQPWGIVSTVLFQNELLSLAGLQELQNINIAIQNYAQTNPEANMMAGDIRVFEDAQIVQPLLLPHGEWTIAASWYDEVRAYSPNWLSISVIFIGFILWNLIVFQRYEARRERERSGIELKRAKARFEAFFNDNAANIILLTHKGTVIEANQSVLSWFGKHRQQVKGQPIGEVLGINDSSIEQQILNMSPYGTSNLNCIGHTTEGRKTHLQLLLSNVQFEGESFISAILNDIETQVRQQKQLELSASVFKHSKQAIMITDAEQNIISINPAFTRIMGFHPEEVIGAKPKILASGAHDAAFYKEMFESLEQNGYWEGEISNRHKNNSLLREIVAISTIKNEQGQIERYVAIYTDITELKTQHDTISRLQRLELIGQLSAGVAHDFNNILGIIAGYTDLIKTDSPTPQNAKYYKTIDKAIERAKNLTTRLLLSSKKTTMDFKSAPLNDLLVETKTLLEKTLTPMIQLKFELDGESKAKVNSVDFEDVILNLVVNSKNAIDGHGTITIQTEYLSSFNDNQHHEISRPSSEPKDGYTVVTVKDNGCGIRFELFDDIFLPFKTFSENGTGLGLAMVAGFAARYNYGLTIHSLEQVGTEISIWIPITQENIEARTPSLATMTESDVLTGKHVVIIDDEEELLELMKKFLISEGNKVSCFDDPQQAMDFISENINGLDLIITDEVMPGSIQGHNLIDIFAGKLPFLLVTGYMDKGSKLKRPYSIIGKPFTREQFLTGAMDAIKRIKNAS